MNNIAIKSNEESVCELVIKKLEREGYIKPNSMTVGQLVYMFYIPELDIIASPLALEMHHPKYKEIYGNDYLNMEELSNDK